MPAFAATLAALLHCALMLVLAPLLSGIGGALRARLRGEAPPPVLQPWHEARRLLAKEAALPASASALSRAAPCVAVAATIAAAAAVPGFAHGTALASLADLVLLAGLLALPRAARFLAALDAGQSQSAATAARGLGAALLAEPVLLLAALAFGVTAGSGNLDAMAAALAEGAPTLRLPLLLLFLSLLAATLAANARPPFDPAAAETMLLDAGGPLLALWRYAAALQFAVWLALLAALFLPFGTVPAGGSALFWLPAALLWCGKLLILAVLVAAMEALGAPLPARAAAQLLGAALLLGLLGAVLLFAGARPA